MGKLSKIVSIIFIFILLSISCTDRRCVITYTTTDSKPIQLDSAAMFNGVLIEYSYKNGKGKLLFDRPIVRIENAFRKCVNLETIILPKNITAVGDFAFEGCSSLSSITIPDGCTRIGDCAFRDCPNLKHINIPSNIDSIGDYAFARCQHLIDTIIDIKISHLGEGIFQNCLDVTMEFF